MPRPRSAALAPLVLVAALVAGCNTGGTSLSASRSTIPSTTTTLAPRGNVDGVLRIGALLPVTGDGAALGPSLLAGIQLALREINKAGGFNARPVELVQADEAGDPAAAAVALEDLVERQDVDAIIGPVSTRVTLSLLSPLTSAGVLACSPTNTAIALSEYPDNGSFFRTAPSDALQAVALARAVAETGGRTTAILYVDDDYGRGIADSLATELRRLGNEVVARTAIDPAALDDEPQLRAVLDRDPAAIVFAGPREPGTRVIATLRRLGLAPERVPVFVSDGMRMGEPATSAVTAAGDGLEGVQGTALAAAVSSSNWFRDALAADYPKAANLYAGYAYDCMNLIALAAQEVRSDDPRLLRDAMVDVSTVGTTCRNFVECTGRLALGSNIDLDGASGPIEFGPNGDPQWGTFDLFRFDPDGRDVTERQLLVRGHAA